MQFYTLLISALSLVAAAVAAPTYTPTVQLTYDPTYDVASNSLDIVACSNGANGLEHLGTSLSVSAFCVLATHELTTCLGYKTFGDLPNFPYIGGMQAVTGLFTLVACNDSADLLIFVPHTLRLEFARVRNMLAADLPEPHD